MNNELGCNKKNRETITNRTSEQMARFSQFYWYNRMYE